MFKRGAALLIALALHSIGCTRPATLAPGTLVVALSAQPLTLDPRYATDSTGMRIVDLIFEALVRIGPQLEPLPEAAQTWTYHDHIFTFHLRPDMHFHNGRAVSAEDLEFSFAEFTGAGSPFASTLDIIKKVTVTTDTKKNQANHFDVKIELKNYSDKFLKVDLKAIKIIPKAEVLANGRGFGQILIGSGPFKFEKQSADAIELTGVRSVSPHLLFKVIRDDFTRFQKVLKGEIDIVQTEIGPDKVPEFQKHPERFQVFIYPGLSMSYLVLNLRDPVLTQKAVREALSRSIEREDLIRYKLNGLALEATSLLTPNNPYYLSGMKNPAFDLRAAQASIEALGLKGKSLTLKTSNAPQATDNGKVLAYQMKRSGLDIQIQSFEWGTYYADIKKGNFQLALMRWTGTIDPDIYRQAFHSRERPPGRNRGSYSNPKVDTLLDASATEEDPLKRRKIMNEVQALVQEDIAIIPLWYDQQIAVAKKSVSGYAPDVTGEYWPLTQAKKSE